MIFIYPYSGGSKSAKSLASALGAKRIKLSGSNFKEGSGKIVLNWGSSVCPYHALNSAHSVSVAANKLKTFNHLHPKGVPLPEFTVSRSVAEEWLKEGSSVVCRAVLTGSSGQGITIMKGGELPEVPLYTKYTPKKDEYRVHIFDGEVIDIQRKMRKKDVPDDEVNWSIRNLAGGFIFGREGIDPPPEVLEAAKSSVSGLGLLFGAVDLGWSESHGVRVYEVNTAPGLEGTTLSKYSEAIKKYIGE